METQKLVNLLNSSENEYSKFGTKNGTLLTVIQRVTNYSLENPIKLLTKSIESSLCDYSDAHVLVTGNIAVTGGNANIKVAFKNCAPFNNAGQKLMVLLLMKQI